MSKIKQNYKHIHLELNPDKILFYTNLEGNTIHEEFKDISKYEGYYQISSFGRVKSLERMVPHGHSNSVKLIKCKIINRKLYKNSYYIDVVLRINATPYTKRVHKLVAEAFLNHNTISKEETIDHIDGNKLDNRLCNLQILTPREHATKTFKSIKTSSKYIGVSFCNINKNWRASILVRGKSIWLGVFNTEDEASEYYQDALKCINENRISDIKVKKHKSSSKHKGVSFSKKENKWRSYVITYKKQKNVGTFDSEEEAYQARENYLNKKQS